MECIIKSAIAAVEQLKFFIRPRDPEELVPCRAELHLPVLEEHVSTVRAGDFIDLLRQQLNINIRARIARLRMYNYINHT